MPRAASRLKKSRSSKIKGSKTKQRAKKRIGAKKSSILVAFWERISRSFSQQTLAKQYFSHLPTLAMAGIFAYLTSLLMHQVHPSQVKHFILPNSYLPLLILVFITTFFLVSWMLLNTRRGFLAALALSLILFLRVQQVVLNPSTILIILSPLLVIEVAVSLINKRSWGIIDNLAALTTL